jgi:hypothetical protein
MIWGYPNFRKPPYGLSSFSSLKEHKTRARCRSHTAVGLTQHLLALGGKDVSEAAQAHSCHGISTWNSLVKGNSGCVWKWGKSPEQLHIFGETWRISLKIIGIGHPFRWTPLALWCRWGILSLQLGWTSMSRMAPIVPLQHYADPLGSRGYPSFVILWPRFLGILGILGTSSFQDTENFRALDQGGIEQIPWDRRIWDPRLVAAPKGKLLRFLADELFTLQWLWPDLAGKARNHLWMIIIYIYYYY